jgi:hypothetical protein
MKASLAAVLLVTAASTSCLPLAIPAAVAGLWLALTD